MLSNAKQRVFNLSIMGLLAIGLMLVAAGLAMTPGTVAADPVGDPPGNDGVCQHGNSDKSCREDPQPDHGKDCESHGANADGNEDHCLADELNEPPVTSSPPPSTSTTENEPEEEPEVLQIEQGNTTNPAAQEVAEVLGAEDVPEVVALPFAGSRAKSSNGTNSWLALAALGTLVAVGGTCTAVWRRRASM
jgi:hypothetical protein